LHAAKGSEFDNIFLPGWEEDVFPHRRSLDEKRVGALEEERRLAYVGLTRARKKVYISYAANRRVYNQWQSNLPSRFLSELPNEILDTITETGIVLGGKRNSSSLNISDLDQDKYQKNNINLSVGIRIFHQKFGYGKIISIDNNKLSINFEKAGTKKVLSSFVELPP